MGKKAKTKRQENYKGFLDGMVTYREKFVAEKLALVEKMLADESVKSELMNKDRKTMTKVERAAVDTVVSRELNSAEQFDEIKETIQDDQVRSAKFKYTPKVI